MGNLQIFPILSVVLIRIEYWSKFKNVKHSLLLRYRFPHIHLYKSFLLFKIEDSLLDITKTYQRRWRKKYNISIPDRKSMLETRIRILNQYHNGIIKFGTHSNEKPCSLSDRNLKEFPCEWLYIARDHAANRQIWSRSSVSHRRSVRSRLERSVYRRNNRKCRSGQPSDGLGSSASLHANDHREGSEETALLPITYRDAADRTCRGHLDRGSVQRTDNHNRRHFTDNPRRVRNAPRYIDPMGLTDTHVYVLVHTGASSGSQSERTAAPLCVPLPP